MDGQILASTLPREDAPALSALLDGGEHACERHVPRRGIRRAAAAAGAGQRRPASRSGPVALILRSRTEQLRFLHTIHTELGGDRGHRRHPRDACSALPWRERSRGRWRPSPPSCAKWRRPATSPARSCSRHASEWDDEDAQLLATTFNTLTDSIAQAQREISQTRAAVVARTAVHGDRARSPQSADDHQGGAAHAAAGERRARRRSARRPPTSTGRSSG